MGKKIRCVGLQFAHAFFKCHHRCLRLIQNLVHNHGALTCSNDVLTCLRRRICKESPRGANELHLLSILSTWNITAIRMKSLKQRDFLRLQEFSGSAAESTCASPETSVNKAR